MKKIYLLSASILCIIGCSKTIVPDENVPGASEMTLTADMAQFAHETKTSIDGTSIKWTAGDQIKVYNTDGTYSQTFTLSDGAGTTFGTFTGTWDNTKTAAAAFYPASECSGYASETGFTVNIPKTQAYAANTVGNGAFPMVGTVSGGSISFKNAFGILKLSLMGSGNVSSIVLTDLANPLAGVFTIKTDGTATKSTTASENIYKTTLQIASPQALNGTTDTDFYIAVPAGTLSAGFTAEVMNGKGHPMEVLFTVKSNNAIVRNKIMSMPSKTVNMNKLSGAGYTEVSYIQSSGTQYIDTGIVPSASSGFGWNQNINILSAGNVIATMGCGGTYGGNNIYCYGLTTDSNGVFIEIGLVRSTIYNADRNTFTGAHTEHVYFSGGSANMLYDGSHFTQSYNTDQIPTANTMYIFATHYRDGTTKYNTTMKLYYTTIFKDGEVVANYIPCKSSSDVAGLYDTVNGAFLTNSGTGSFTAGDDVMMTSGCSTESVTNSSSSQW